MFKYESLMTTATHVTLILIASGKDNPATKTLASH